MLEKAHQAADPLGRDTGGKEEEEDKWEREGVLGLSGLSTKGFCRVSRDEKWGPRGYFGLSTFKNAGAIAPVGSCFLRHLYLLLSHRYPYLRGRLPDVPFPASGMGNKFWLKVLRSHALAVINHSFWRWA